METIGSTFFTSDWHCFHEKVIEFDNRPFKNISHMHEVLINNYNACVRDNSICYFLGDFAMGNVEKAQSIVKRLNGTKVIILGNHDRNAVAMQRIGFDIAVYSASLVIGGKLVTMTHCPLRGILREDVSTMRNSVEGDNWHGERKHQNFSVPDYGQFHLHGHCHKTSEEKILGKQWDVGVRANDYRPVSSSQIESWIAQSINKQV